MPISTSKNAFLGGQITILQPSKGYRAGLDAVMLSAAVSPKPGQSVVDIGCGVGTVMVCLAHRYPHAKYTGFELQSDLIKLAQETIILNKQKEICQVIQGDIQDQPSQLQSQSFDHVVTNPPYFSKSQSTPSPYETKALSHREQIPLSDWLAYCIKILKPRGTLTLIYPTEKLDQVLKGMDDSMGEIKIFPLWPKAGHPSKRVLIQARKQIQAGLQLLPGLILHKDSGENTPVVKAILEGREGIRWV